ncbi:NrfD/PsrC family molybdoenzyme membrane anchor subunit [Desulfuribacillus alkaliarsenatis]|uniref:Polysulfide reductase n=1 Tax=Desulfuribacillus alkaliarsenatis TaxID=766136 RepID=A0A1E5G570_9FIRM|nr:NrfD/PsrC family molybdoenzyme membrane anchor subunit [Desulfuribacillus alkaliarsenatis]OEF98303.1 hypothetical protein BHF68_01080 [Desulfuribacillus alkaliarsenatis]
MKEALHQETPMPSRFNKNIPLLGFAAVLAVIFAYGGVMSFLYGHGVWGTSDEVPWGILITAYVYFAVGCTGLCLLSSLAHVFHFKPYESMGLRPVILAIVSMITAFIIIALELKYVLNMAIYLVLSPNFKSVFVLMGMLYGAYLVFLILELFTYALGYKKLSRYLAIVAIITGVSATSNLGLVFGSLVARSYWTAPMMPIMWIVSALVTGAAALIILYYFVDREQSRANTNHLVNQFRKLLGYFILGYFALNAFHIFMGLTSSNLERQEAANFLLFGDYAINFWVMEVGILVLALAVVFLLSNNQRAIMMSSVLVLIAMMFARHNTVTAGQIVSLTPDGQGPIKILSYSPTFVEWAMTFGAFGIIIIAYIVLEYVVVFVKDKFGKKEVPAATEATETM